VHKLATEYGGRVQVSFSPQGLHPLALTLFVQFLKVDVDRVQDLAQEFRVQAMPTFMILKGSQKIEEMKGANPAALTALIKKHAPAVGVVGGSGSSSSGPVEKGLEGFVSYS